MAYPHELTGPKGSGVGRGRGRSTGRAGGGRCDLGRRKHRPPRPVIGPTPPRRPADGGGETRRGRAVRRLSVREMWAPSGPGPAGWDRRRVGARLRAALAGLQELQGLRATQQARVRGALGLHQAPGPRGQELRLEAALAALREQLVRSKWGTSGRRGVLGRDPGAVVWNVRTERPDARLRGERAAGRELESRARNPGLTAHRLNGGYNLGAAARKSG